MNANTYELAPETTLAESAFPTTVSLSALLPYAALAVTIAAFTMNAPARLADLVRNERAPRLAAQAETHDLLASSSDYPMRGQTPLLGRTIQTARLLRR